MIPRIDAHQHFWNYDPIRNSWITDEMEIIRKDFHPADLERELVANGLDGCVSVQADSSLRETDFLLELARKNDFVKGVVGWVDLRGDDLDIQLGHYSGFEKFKGARHIVQAEPKGFLSDRKFLQGVRLVHEFDLTYDILSIETQLEEVLRFIQSLPEMRLVVDHISKPDIRNGSFEQWAKYMKKIGNYQHVYVKLSGMVTEANWSDWSKETLMPYVDLCIEEFGANRLMFGSDWPVCLAAGTYSKVKDVLESCISDLSSEEQAQIMGGTACRFYHLAY